MGFFPARSRSSNPLRSWVQSASQMGTPARAARSAARWRASWTSSQLLEGRDELFEGAHAQDGQDDFAEALAGDVGLEGAFGEPDAAGALAFIAARAGHVDGGSGAGAAAAGRRESIIFSLARAGLVGADLYGHDATFDVAYGDGQARRAGKGKILPLLLANDDAGHVEGDGAEKIKGGASQGSAGLAAPAGVAAGGDGLGAELADLLEMAAVIGAELLAAEEMLIDAIAEVGLGFALGADRNESGLYRD